MRPLLSQKCHVASCSNSVTYRTVEISYSSHISIIIFLCRLEFGSLLKRKIWLKRRERQTHVLVVYWHQLLDWHWMDVRGKENLRKLKFYDCRRKITHAYILMRRCEMETAWRRWIETLQFRCGDARRQQRRANYVNAVGTWDSLQLWRDSAKCDNNVSTWTTNLVYLWRYRCVYARTMCRSWAMSAKSKRGEDEGGKRETEGKKEEGAGKNVDESFARDCYRHLKIATLEFHCHPSSFFNFYYKDPWIYIYL